MRELVAQDNQFLSKGKIDWESILLPITNEIGECKKQLSIPDAALMYLEVHPDFSIEKHKADFEERLVKSRAELSKLIALISDKEVTKRIEALANEIKKWKEHDSSNAHLEETVDSEYKQPIPHQYPWEHVALSMLRFPDKVIFDYDRCPQCGNSRIRIFFYSPECTWAMMCGVGGDMVICPDCKIQAEFNETIRN